MVSGYEHAAVRSTIYRFLEGQSELGYGALGQILYVLGLEVRRGATIPRPPPMKRQTQVWKKIPPRPVDITSDDRSP